MEWHGILSVDSGVLERDSDTIMLDPTDVATKKTATVR
jgi:hypothetical protein